MSLFRRDPSKAIRPDVTVSGPTNVRMRGAFTPGLALGPASAALQHGIPYNATPTFAQWRADSHVGGAAAGAAGAPDPTRPYDSILARIDTLLTTYHLPESQPVHTKIMLKIQLFFALDQWLKHHEHDRNAGDPLREPAVYGFYKYTALSLANSMSCGINALPEKLERLLGSRIGWGSHLNDVIYGHATYLTRAQAAKYRLSFENGRVMMWTWRDKATEGVDGFREIRPRNTNSMSLVLADSSTAYDAAALPGRIGWGGFVLSMGRDFYMGRHHLGNHTEGTHANFYHSTYLGGEPVLCAGTIRIEAGVVTGIANDSGHYKPHETSLLQALEALGTYVGLQQCKVWASDGRSMRPKGTADAFIAANGRWNANLLGVADPTKPWTKLQGDNDLNDVRYHGRPGSPGARTDFDSDAYLFYRGWLRGQNRTPSTDAEHGLYMKEFAQNWATRTIGEMGIQPLPPNRAANDRPFGAYVDQHLFVEALQRARARLARHGQYGALPPET